MSQRIRDLEDALALLQASISAEKHILLRNELLLIKNGPERQRSAEPDTHEDPLAAPVDAFGTLTIGDSGESRYFGASAGSEVCPITAGVLTDHIVANILADFAIGACHLSDIQSCAAKHVS